MERVVIIVAMTTSLVALASAADLCKLCNVQYIVSRDVLNRHFYFPAEYSVVSGGQRRIQIMKDE